MRGGALTAIAGLVLAALSIPLPVHAGAPVSLPLVAQIQHRSPGFKLRPGERTTVRIRVEGGIQDSVHWALSLRREDVADATEPAAGDGEVTNTAVTELLADALAPGEKYTLILMASDGETTSQSTAAIVTTDAAYSLIPLFADSAE